MCTSCVKNTNIFLTTLLCFILGDIGYYDEDGHLIIKDRMKELIKVKGHQVKSSFVGTNCYSTGSQRSHSCCPVANNICHEWWGC